jgi:hypothetical protein
LELAGEDDYTRGGAVERLLPLLERMGCTPEADALRDREVAREREWKDRLSQKPAPGTDRYPPAVGSPKAVTGALSSPYIREAPKVGRNDPCPCGSGHKYKTCCLGIVNLLTF